MAPQSRSVGWFGIATTIMLIAAVVGMSASVFPSSNLIQAAPGHDVSFANVARTTAESTGNLQVTYTSATEPSSIAGDGQMEFQQIQQLAHQDGEGALYEDIRSRRSRILICVEIAKRLSGGPLSVTDIALLARINFSLAKVCIEQMTSAGLIEGDQTYGDRKYLLSRKGLLFLEHGETTLKMLEPVTGTRQRTTQSTEELIGLRSLSAKSERYLPEVSENGA